MDKDGSNYEPTIFIGYANSNATFSPNGPVNGSFLSLNASFNSTRDVKTGAYTSSIVDVECQLE